MNVTAQSLYELGSGLRYGNWWVFKRDWKTTREVASSGRSTICATEVLSARSSVNFLIVCCFVVSPKVSVRIKTLHFIIPDWLNHSSIIAWFINQISFNLGFRPAHPTSIYHTLSRLTWLRSSMFSNPKCIWDNACIRNATMRFEELWCKKCLKPYQHAWAYSTFLLAYQYACPYPLPCVHITINTIDQ